MRSNGDSFEALRTWKSCSDAVRVDFSEVCAKWGKFNCFDNLTTKITSIGMVNLTS